MSRVLKESIARRRAVALYATTFFVSMIIVSGGVSLIALQRAARRLQDNIISGEQSYLLARGGLEWTLAYVDSEPDWRDFITNGGSTTLSVDGLGDMTVMLVDGDGDLADSDADAVGLRIVSETDGARRGYEMSARPGAHPALSYALYTPGTLYFEDETNIYGPVYSRTSISSSYFPNVYDDGYFVCPPDASISWWLDPKNENAEDIETPEVDLTYYKKIATPVYPTGTNEFKSANLTSTENTWGDVNPQGVYMLDIGNDDFRIRRVHVKGTLIIVGRGKVAFTDYNIFEPGDSGFPSLLIDVGSDEQVVFAMSGPFDEEWDNCDYPGDCLDVNGDGDYLDRPASSLSGLVWSNARRVRFKGEDWVFKGCLICPKMEVEDGIRVDNDPGLAVRLIPGFTDGSLHVDAGSIREISP